MRAAPRWIPATTVLILALSACTAAAPATASVPAASTTAAAAAGTAAAATSSQCASPAAPTAEETEGPYFKAGSPARASLVESGMSGTRLVLSGVVISRSCAAVAGATLDFWQADASGNYDNSGYRLRGHLSTDTQGRYQLETVVPGLYPGRTRHIHVKVQAPAGRVVTTQLYFPNEQANASDSIFQAANVIRVDQSSTTWAGRFDFVLDLP